jgi:hypothetical protein
MTLAFKEPYTIDAKFTCREHGKLPSSLPMDGEMAMEKIVSVYTLAFLFYSNSLALYATWERNMPIPLIGKSFCTYEISPGPAP